jgi:crotonobetainyl-CoA:carnitine CoA-transferase CaiB-like acyl-CoA transferase
MADRPEGFGTSPAGDREGTKLAGPLEGVRVLDFTWSVAGPTITTILAALGAEVIKVEWPQRADMMRQTMFATGVKATLDSGCFYASVNPGKRNFTCNVKTEGGRRLIEQLVPKVDLITESFANGVMERWGFSYNKLRSLREDVIYLRLCGFGHTGRYSTYNTWGPTAQAFNGLTAMSGLPGEPPAGWGFSYMDIMAGYMGALAALMALYYRRRTGEGQYIDMSQVEAGIGLTGSALLDGSVNGRGPDRAGMPPGNRAVWSGRDVSGGFRGELGAPYNCYPCAGGTRFDYCAITVLNSEQWLSLKTAMGNPAWSDEDRFATAAARVANQDALDSCMAEWTKQFPKNVLMEELQKAGVPCGALQSMEDLVENDPQLKQREVFATADHPLLGTRRWQTIPLKLSASPSGFTPRWPLFAQDNEYVLRELLGLSAEDVAALEEAHVFWPEDMPRDVAIERALW